MPCSFSTTRYRRRSGDDTWRWRRLKLGYGGQSYLASVVGCNRDTVASGIAELATLPDEASENRIRRPGGGRKKATVSEPDLVDNFF